MDGGTFDKLARGLGAQRSRRSVVKLLGAAALGAVGVAGFRHEADAAGKVGICHRTGSASNPWVYITVASQAAPAHAAHGDTISPNFGSDTANCGGCGNVCSSAPVNAHPTCVDGACGYACNHGDLGDTNNCGGCGIVCEAPANATATCDGTCGYTCNNHYHDDGEGGCAYTCDVYGPYATPQCFWMENNTGHYCFIPYPIDNQAACEAANTCGQGYGGCYKWSTSSN